MIATEIAELANELVPLVAEPALVTARVGAEPTWGVTLRAFGVMRALARVSLTGTNQAVCFTRSTLRPLRIATNDRIDGSRTGCWRQTLGSVRAFAIWAANDRASLGHRSS